VIEPDPNWHGLATLPVADYTVITPYLIPPGLNKKVNVGDGFILDSATRLIGCRPAAVLSSRARLDEVAIERINASRFVVAVGANTLKDDFEITPGCTLDTLASIRVPIVLMGLGHYGVQQATRGLTPTSINLLRAVLERFPLMSVRCDASQRYVMQSLPDLADKVLMTGCPVMYPVDGIDRQFRRKPHYDLLVVTLTDRAFLQEQLPLLEAGRRLFPATRRVLALHQDFGNAMLWSTARNAGFEVFRSEDCRDFLALYAQADLHFGNRVHAHLKTLSHGTVSFCTPFDLRQAYFAESLDCPLVSPADSAHIAHYDFDRMRSRRERARPAMERFVAALHGLL
jgi:Polysaccharide pyruvyl transferase